MNRRSSIDEKIIKAMPYDEEFRAVDIADKIFPNLVRSDSEGRLFNRGVAVVARHLRLIRGVQEIRDGVFYAHVEFFTPPYCPGQINHS